MFYKDFYSGKTEKEIEKDIRKEGFDPIKISNNSGFVYHSHQHPEKKLLAFLEGGMEVTIGTETFHCKKGDKVLIDGNTIHRAVVGGKGCIFFWSEKL